MFGKRLRGRKGKVFGTWMLCPEANRVGFLWAFGFGFGGAGSGNFGALDQEGMGETFTKGE